MLRVRSILGTIPGGGRRVLETLGFEGKYPSDKSGHRVVKHESLRFHPMPPWITKESHRPRVSNRTMRCRLSKRTTVRLVSFRNDWRRHDSEMEPQGARTISPFRVTKRSTKHRLRKTTRRSRVHVQTVGLNAETKKCWHRADGEKCLLTFPFIALVRLAR